MRVMLIWEYYPRYIRSLDARIRLFEGKTFAEQVEVLLDDCFGWNFALARRLRERGHEVFFCLANFEHIQRKWCAEHGVVFPGRGWRHAVALKQAEAFRPDVVWMGSSFGYYGAFLQKLQHICRCRVAWVACPVPEDIDLSPFAMVLTSHSNLAQKLEKQHGGYLRILLPAFEPGILTRTPETERDIPLTFVGSFSTQHRHRMRLLTRLAMKMPLQLWGSGVPVEPGWMGWRLVAKRLVPALIRGPLDECYKGERWGLQMYTLLRRSQVTLNVHGEVAGGVAGNIRMFEATGMGALLVTERATNLAELFEADREVVTYSDGDEMECKIKYYLEHDKEREEIARRGQARTLREHSTQQRCKELEVLLRLAISRAS